MMLTTYPKWFEATFRGRENEFKFVRDLARSAPGGRLLDIGCGAGRILRAGLDRPLYLLDPSEEFLNLARASSTDQDIQFLQASADQIPLPDSSVAAICMLNNTLAEVSPIAFALAESARVLADGGIFYSLTRNPDCPQPMVFGADEVIIDGDPFYSSFEAFPTAAIGRYHFETYVTLRNRMGNEQRLFVPQVYPPRQFIRAIAHGVGLSEIAAYQDIDKNEFVDDASPLLHWFARKSRPLDESAIFPGNKERYENLAESYDDITSKAEYRVPRWLEENLKNDCRINRRCLDLACGTGTVGEILRSLGETGLIYGIDFSPSMLAQCRAKGHYRALLCHDFSKTWPIVEETYFDRVFFCSASEFVQDLPTVIANIAKALVRKGTLFITFEKTTPQSATSGSVDLPSRTTKFHYTYDQVLGMMSAANLDIVSIDDDVGYHSPSSQRDIPYYFVVAQRRRF